MMKVANGSVQLNVAISGNTEGAVVLMAHSLGCNLHMWDAQLSTLEEHYKVVRLDMRGHGLSDVPPGPYTLELLADDVIAVMDNLHIDKAHWVGLSIGGMIGQSLLLRFPERFISAVLSDTASMQAADAGPLWSARIKAVETDGLSSIAELTMGRWFTPFLATPDDGYVACCRAIMQLNYIDELENINTPVCLIVGAEDQATPVEASEAMHTKIPNSELHIVNEASHIANVEKSDVFNEILFSFLQSTSAGYVAG